MEKLSDNFIQVRNVDPEKKRKAVFVLKCKGQNLSEAVREMTEQLAKEFDEMNK